MNRFLLTSFLLLLTVNIVKAQYSLEGVVLNTKNNQPVSNVNVFLKGVNIGSATNKEGKFKIEPVLNKHKSRDLIISCMGYNTVLIPSDSIRVNKLDTFYLKENTFDLKEVEIPGSFELKRVGYLGFGRNDRNNFYKSLKENWAIKLNNKKAPFYIDEIQIYGKSGMSNNRPKIKIGFHSIDSIYNIPGKLITKKVVEWPYKKDKSRWVSFKFQKPVKVLFEAFFITFKRLNLDAEFALGYKSKGIPVHFDSRSISKRIYSTKWDKFDGFPIIRLRINEQKND